MTYESLMVGIDEVGRGSWAGPLAVGAVMLPSGCDILGLGDSKALSAKQRQALALDIKRLAAAAAVGWASSSEIDQLGLTAALRLAAGRALSRLGGSYEDIVLDGSHNYLNVVCPVRTVVRGDSSEAAVAAAAIIAKVARDRYMHLQHSLYPQYGFSSNVGYGTAAHSRALAAAGATPLHRHSFAPIARLVDGVSLGRF